MYDAGCHFLGGVQCSLVFFHQNLGAVDSQLDAIFHRHDFICGNFTCHALAGNGFPAVTTAIAQTVHARMIRSFHYLSHRGKGLALVVGAKLAAVDPGVADDWNTV